MAVDDFGRVGLVFGGDYNRCYIWVFEYRDAGGTPRAWEVRFSPGPEYVAPGNPELDWEFFFSSTDADLQDFLARFHIEWLERRQSRAILEDHFSLRKILEEQAARRNLWQRLCAGMKERRWRRL